MEFITLAPPLLKAFWYVAIFSSVFFIGFLAMSAAGGGDAHHGGDFDGDAGHGDGDFRPFSIRNLINFLLGFSWSGIGLYAHIAAKPILLTVALSVGAAMVYFLFKAMQAIVRLGRDQTIQTADAIGRTGTVYLTVPAQRSGKGKVSVSLGGVLKEYEAVTDGPTLPTGQAVTVAGIVEEAVLLVAPLP